jgi:hypothetical protein
MTTVIATWFGDVCTPLMVGACNPFRCAVDGLPHINVDRDLERSAGRLSAEGAFQAKWTPVRVKKTRQTKSWSRLGFDSIKTERALAVRLPAGLSVLSR